MSDKACRLYILPTELIQLIYSYHSCIKLELRLVNKNYRDMIRYFDIKILNFNKAINRIYKKIYIDALSNIYIPFGLLLEWNIAYRFLINGNLIITYSNSIKSITHWLHLINTSDHYRNLSIIYINAAIRWSNGQKFF